MAVGSNSVGGANLSDALDGGDGAADRTSFVMGPLPVSLDASTRLAFRAQTDQPAASVAQSIQLLGIV